MGPNITNLIHIRTLKGMHYLVGILFKKNFENVIPRNINQDALKIFFGCIRSHGVQNNSPDVSHFICSFNSLVINNYMSMHSVGRNCMFSNNLSVSLSGAIIITPSSCEVKTETRQYKTYCEWSTTKYNRYLYTK
jgi:hypothetical protein